MGERKRQRMFGDSIMIIWNNFTGDYQLFVKEDYLEGLKMA